MVAVAVDVGKNMVALSVTDDQRQRLLGPVDFAMTRSGLTATAAKIDAVVPPRARVRVGVEAAGTITSRCWCPRRGRPVGSCWELNPGHVTEQRRVQGRRRVKTDAVDLEAITELVLTGHGSPVTAGALVLGELGACPGLTLALPDVLGTQVGRLVAEHFADPARLAALGESRFVRLAATRGLQVRGPVAARLVAAARDALPTRDAAVARTMLAEDLGLLQVLEAQVADAEDHLAQVLPQSPFAVLTSVPGWAVVRAAGYGAALGDPARWPGPRQVYRASGLSPAQYESAGRRRDGAISREGSVDLRRALIDLGMGLWLNEASAKSYAAVLRARGRAERPALRPRAARTRPPDPTRSHTSV